MVTNINTPVGGSANVGTATQSKGSNTLIYVVLGAVALYLGYKYLIKPELDKKKEEQK